VVRRIWLVRGMITIRRMRVMAARTDSNKLA
jgi:hypothetical protein